MDNPSHTNELTLPCRVDEDDVLHAWYLNNGEATIALTRDDQDVQVFLRAGDVDALVAYLRPPGGPCGPSPFAVGQVVRLNSGGPAMTVEAVRDDERTRVVWDDGVGGFTRDDFPAACLVP
jgi:uncharacterized protein YodC (DUF2158 family)